jgi:hypothetical protein
MRIAQVILGALAEGEVNPEKEDDIAERQSVSTDAGPGLATGPNTKCRHVRSCAAIEPQSLGLPKRLPVPDVANHLVCSVRP